MLDKNLPIGVSDFAKLRTGNWYYVDKTLFIRDFFRYKGEVNLFTRPRRFGKSLLLSMVQAFFETGEDPSLFSGLKIEQERDICERYQNQYPVVSISLKDLTCKDLRENKMTLIELIKAEAARHAELENYPAFNWNDLQSYNNLRSDSEHWSNETITSSLAVLCRLLAKVHGKRAVILIDEYDVPLQKAWLHGKEIYEQMVELIRNLFSKALKDNEFLEFAILAGCLQLPQQSIFTGLNNIKVFSVTNPRLDEYFGFTEAEVQEMLDDYNASAMYETTKKWYYGYLFGRTKVYCPWDILSWCDILRDSVNSEPECFWLNTSGNDIVRMLLHHSSSMIDDRKQIGDDLDALLAGGTITKVIHQRLTYDSLTQSLDSIWSTLFLTGYLTSAVYTNGKTQELKIPNREIHEIFADEISTWIRDGPKRQKEQVNAILSAMFSENVEAMQRNLNLYLEGLISIRDYMARPAGRSGKENFYYALMTDFLSDRRDVDIISGRERESGERHNALILKNRDRSLGIVLEFRYSTTQTQLEADALDALKQIDDMQYDMPLRQENLKNILHYGLAFYHKTCCVVSKRI